MQQEMNLHSTHMYFYTSLITLKFMKTTVARQLWTRTLAVQFLYPVQNCCVWMLSASKCPNVSLLWLQAVELTLQKLEPCRSSLGSENKLSRELWCFSLFILPSASWCSEWRDCPMPLSGCVCCPITSQSNRTNWPWMKISKTLMLLRIEFKYKSYTSKYLYKNLWWKTIASYDAYFLPVT